MLWANDGDGPSMKQGAGDARYDAAGMDCKSPEHIHGVVKASIRMQDGDKSQCYTGVD